eukprot:3508776-Pyramimonas_sp.AAC.1
MRARRDRGRYPKLTQHNDEQGADAAAPGGLHRDEFTQLLESTYPVKQKGAASDEHWLQALAETRGRPVPEP